MHLRSRNCRTCNWAFEGGRILVYPKLAAEPGPPPVTPGPGYTPPKWMVVALACPTCGTPMTFDLPVSIDVAGARDLAESS